MSTFQLPGTGLVFNNPLNSGTQPKLTFSPTSNVNLSDLQHDVANGGLQVNYDASHLLQPTAFQGGSTTSGGSTVSGGSAVNSNPYADSSYNPLYSTYQGQANTALSDLLGAYNTANKQTNSNYDTQGKELQSGYKNTQNTYKNQVTSQNQDLLRQDNQIHQGVAHAYQNLLNLLGAYGGGSSSVALNWAPTAATKFEQMQAGGAGQNAAENLHSLATAWGIYNNQFANEKKKLADSRAQDLANNQSSYDTTKSHLNEILQAIQSRSVDPTTLGGELGSIRSSIPHNKFVQPTYTGTTPVYNAPALSTFEAAVPTTNFSQQMTGNSSTVSPLSILLGQKQKQTNQLG